ncbi:MAG: hypothetical protein ACRDRJ_53795 [Streptosporangiaceae bacterium]
MLTNVGGPPSTVATLSSMTWRVAVLNLDTSAGSYRPSASSPSAWQVTSHSSVGAEKNRCHGPQGCGAE